MQDGCQYYSLKGRFEPAKLVSTYKDKTYGCLPNDCGVPNVLGNDGRNSGAGDDAGLQNKENVCLFIHSDDNLSLL